MWTCIYTWSLESTCFFCLFKKNRFFSQNAFYGLLELFLRFSPIKKKQVLKRFHKTSFDIAASWLKSNLSHPSCGHFQEARAPLPCNMFFSGSILNLIMRRISVSTIYFEVHQTFGLFRSVSYQWKLLWASTLIVMPNLLHEAWLLTKTTRWTSLNSLIIMQNINR